MIVRNLNGTPKNKCNCDSWLDHWKNFSEQDCSTCVVNKCKNTAEVGGHVQRISIIYNTQYIIPLCIGCNNQNDKILYIPESVKLIPANLSETCGKE